ncbi:SETMR methyltransferase, partial [Acromyrmex heyeri]
KDMNSTDIHVIFLYEYKLGNNAAKAARNINQAFEQNTVNNQKVQRWFEKFQSGDFSLQNEPRGRPKTSVKNDALKALVETNPTVSTRELATRMKVDHTTILRHLSEIGKVKKMDKWVPHELTERKLDRLNVCSSLLTRFHREPFFDRIIFRAIFGLLLVMKNGFFTTIGKGVLGSLIGMRLVLILQGHHFIHGKF